MRSERAGGCVTRGRPCRDFRYNNPPVRSIADADWRSEGVGETNFDDARIHDHARSVEVRT